MEKLSYDREIYAGIIRNARLIRFGEGELESILVNKLSKKDASGHSHFQIGELQFNIGHGFNDLDLDNILQVYAPPDTNSLYVDIENRVLTLKFYNIPSDEIK